jgi:hypothetical protein
VFGPLLTEKILPHDGASFFEGGAQESAAEGEPAAGANIFAEYDAAGLKSGEG